MSGLRRWRRPIELAVFGEVPAMFIVLLSWFVAGHGGGWDFAIFRHAGDAVVHGHSPYVHPTVQVFEADDKFVYPMPYAIAFVPFVALPERVGAVCFVLLAVSAVLLSVRLLGVRDRRCYGAALLGLPVIGSLALGTIGPFLLLLCAAAWRYRHHARAGVLLAVAAAAKLFLWPLLVWLLVTRRYRAFAAAVATIVLIVGVWAGVDPSGLRRYPETVRLLNDAQSWKSYSVQTLMLSLHASRHTAALVGWVVAAAAVAAIVLLRRRGDRATFATAICAALIATPILWMHYLVLLIVPIALARPRLAPLWVVPMLLAVTLHPESLGILWRIVYDLLVIAGVAVWTTRPEDVRSAESSDVPVGAPQLSPAQT
jgi:Glycosyltransferase family 87